jgi:hypothetical protein
MAPIAPSSSANSTLIAGHSASHMTSRQTFGVEYRPSATPTIHWPRSRTRRRRQVDARHPRFGERQQQT